MGGKEIITRNLMIQKRTTLSHLIQREHFQASPGQDCYWDVEEQRHHGGNGYSGGGGYCYERTTKCLGSFNGGTDGTAGQGRSSIGIFGYGAGEDLSLYSMDNFNVTPGKGGDEFWDNLPAGTRQLFGGGGGGVLIDGVGPPNAMNLTLTGEGYGGGEGRCSKGMPGVILVEVGQSIKQISNLE